MAPSRPAALALLITLLIAGGVFAASPDCTIQTCVYIPLARKPDDGAPAPTQKPTALPTHTPTTTPTHTLTPTHTPTASTTPTRTTTPTTTATASPTRTATTTATATPVLPPPSFVTCGTPPPTTRAVDWPIQIITIDRVREQVTLFNRSPDPIDLTGWHMCSITGGQEHPISGVLGPYTVHTYSNTGGPIWNNSTPDPGALYDPQGRLVSYLGI